MDITTAFGMLLLFIQARRLRVGGCAWYGIPCNSWIFMSRGTTRRSWFRARGETRYKSVRVGNKIARRVSYLLHYHWVKGHFYVLENPLSSLLWQYRCIRKRLQQHRAVRVVINLGNIGASTQKPVVLWGTAPWLHDLQLKVGSVKKMELGRIRKFLKLQTVRSYRCKKSGQTKVAGGPNLKETQIYPGSLGLAAPKQPT
ncbi:Uncharacterized protein SCF082_LOCUS45928 [Durusdinium trenchii]|uniref:Uncharacterized protein n=1 Tax=Durusdinium trenchii TaxID=1381693 RepID=A0ABP0RCP3_9DINO